MKTALSSVFKYAAEPMSVPRAKALDKIAVTVNQRGTPFDAADMKAAMRDAFVLRLELPIHLDGSLEAPQSQALQSQAPSPSQKPRYPLSFWEPWSICTRAQEEEEEIAGTYEPEYHAPPYEDAVAAEPIEAVNHSPVSYPTLPIPATQLLPDLTRSPRKAMLSEKARKLLSHRDRF
ncbi:uncharacterized protein LAJ45_03715 [Morchella importuna]|uniref:uncharacterized protein n=1 Tax=Morchella importuna TaxID=1174673 RepID=UPI001E8E5C6F|nr:uncharacterized protein LAJ45_03715 [Morchella importuna]KAH8152288.1 hypothetical protein LAJ45_03715 [Morchella importuna]